MDKKQIIERFGQLCSVIKTNEIERTTIGTLGEKCLHLILKNSFEPDTEFHEIKMGRLFADIKNRDGVTEIQTGNFHALKKKLDYFLTVDKVRIIYPIPRIKHLVWIDTETGEITSKRKSPKKGDWYDAFRELYKIKDYLNNDGVTVTLCLIDLTEYRYLDGWSRDKKRGSTRCDRIPDCMVDYVELTKKDDYRILLPENLPKEFTVKEFAKAAKKTEDTASKGVYLLKSIGVIHQTGKKGRAYLYSAD